MFSSTPGTVGFALHCCPPSATTGHHPSPEDAAGTSVRHRYTGSLQLKQLWAEGYSFSRLSPPISGRHHHFASPFGGRDPLPERRCVSANYIVKNYNKSRRTTALDFAHSMILRSGDKRHEFFRCYCVGSLMNPQNATPLNWFSFLDEALLITSIIFAHMAGIVPQNKDFFNAAGVTLDKNTSEADSTMSGRSTESRTDTNLVDLWSEVKDKLRDAVDAFERDGGNFCNVSMSLENRRHKLPLSLLAISVGPRLRLLSATLQQLNGQIVVVPQIHESSNREDWLQFFYNFIQEAVRPICLAWLEGEMFLEKKMHKREFINRILERLEGDDSVLQKIGRLEKTDLYADLLFFLRFGSLKNNYRYSTNVFAQHGIHILEDLLITLSDGVSSIYLELISLDSNLSGEINDLGLSFCTLSTRDLQKLRNEVTLNSWLSQNFDSVVLMYEDRFDMCVLPRNLNGPDISTKESHWWRQLFKKKAYSASSSHYVLMDQLQLFVKRTKELRALTGWRYYYSLVLEFSDITMPLVKAIFIKARNAVSFFLTCLIGRSLGLVYTGIRQSLNWK